MQRIGLIAASLLMTTTSHAADIHKVFGWELHKPIPIRECKRTAGEYGGPSFYSELYPDAGACYEWSDEENHGRKLGTGKMMVMWSGSSIPQLVSGQITFARIVNGLLEGVSFYTAGIRSQEFILSGLTEKYGAPTSSQQPELQTTIGARFKSTSAQWDLGDVLVYFNSADGRIDSGIVNIDTPLSIAKQNEAADKVSRNRPSL